MLPPRLRLPSLGLFNHMILIVDLPGHPAICDPTGRNLAFGELFPGEADADLLPLTAEGSPVQRTPSPGASDNLTELRLAMKVDAQGSAAGHLEVTGKGAWAIELRHRLARGTQETPASTLARAIGARDLHLRSVHADGKSRGPARYSSEVEIPHLLRGSGSIRLLRISQILSTGIPLLAAPTRDGPFLLDFPRSEHVRLELNLNHPVKLVKNGVAPIESRYGRYRLSWTVKGTQLIGERDFEIRASQVPASEYLALKRFFDSVHAIDAIDMVIELGGSQ